MRRRALRAAGPLPAWLRPGWVLPGWLLSAWLLSALLLMTGCSDGACPPWSGAQVPSGRFEHSRQVWIAGMQAQVLEVNHDAETATVEFDKNGVRYRATYRLRRIGFNAHYGTWVTITGVLQPDDCEAAFAQSAVLDAVLLKRGGKVIARAVQQKLEGGCQDAVEPEQVLGDPDGKGVSLAGATVRVRFERYVVIESGDEIEVHATGGYYEVRVSGFSLNNDGRTWEQRIGGGRGTLGWRVP